MLIHDNPAATVIELVLDSEALSGVTVSRLPRGTIQPRRVKFAVASGINADPYKLSSFGDAFSLGGIDEPLPTDITPADVLVVPQSVGALEDLNKVLARLADLSKPNSSIILTGDSKAVPVLEAKGFYPVFAVDGAVLYKQQHEHVKGVNGVNDTASNRRDFVIIEPSAPSSAVKSFSSALQKALGDECHKSVSIAWKDLAIQGSDGAIGKTFISLVELETPLLDNLSEPDFHKVKQLVLSCERLLWVTSGHNPSMAVVDGLSRTMRNENASIKFQVLHLLSSPDIALQHGPSLAVRLATSSTKDNEFREHNGLLQVSRFFNSVTGNEAVRYCLEDSVHVQPLKDKNRPEALRLTIGKPGLLDSLAFIHDERFDAPLGEMEIEVDVKATGVK